MPARVTQDAVEVPIETSSQSARVTQDVVEVPIETSSQSARVTQDVIEVPIETSSQSARVTQDVIEIPIETSSQLARVTQVVIEVLIDNSPPTPPTGCTVFSYFHQGCEVIVWWNDDDADSYILERLEEGGIWTRVTEPGKDVTSYTDTVPRTGVYTYRLRGIWSGYMTEWCYTDPIYTICQEW